MQPEGLAVLSRRRFDVDEYHAMMRAGILHEDDRVELLDGEIVEMSPIGARHASCVMRLTRTLVRAVGDAATVSIQNPIRLDRHSEPEPDAALLRPRADDYAAAPAGPDDVLLVVVVADSSLLLDRGLKLGLYAAARIVEVWIVDLDAETIEICRAPMSGGYGDRCRLASGDTIGPSALPEVRIEVAGILPPR